MRRDFLAALSDIGFIAFRSDAADPVLNLHSDNENLLKAVIAGALWPRVARVSLLAGAIKYDKVQGGAIRRDNVAKDFKLYELRGGQVFLHPASILFSNAGWRSPFAVFFNKHKTTKVFLRDATEVSELPRRGYLPSHRIWS
jgi:ATP-dependent RNA helicase DHX57